ncbi:MAG: PIG-L deacetylase family protein, partial [Desulfotomaculales bacterium]
MGETAPGKILVIAPHPDDETLAAAGVIARSVKQGIPVRVVAITSGDGFSKAASALTGKNPPGASDFLLLGEARQKEAGEAAKVL